MRKQVFGLKELTLQSIEHPQPQLLTIFNSWCPTILLLFIQNSSLSVKDLHLFFSSRIKVFSFHPNHFSSRFQCQCNHSGWISDLGCGLWNPILPISAHGEPRDPSKFVCEPAPCVALSWVLTSAETNSSHFRVILTLIAYCRELSYSSCSQRLLSDQALRGCSLPLVRILVRCLQLLSSSPSAL